MHRAKEDVHEELQEEFLVVKSYTVVHPRTVVVHASDATATGRAVVATRRLQTNTLFAFLA
jgi:hypothetical protein